MTVQSPARSLIERAAQVYGFEALAAVPRPVKLPPPDLSRPSLLDAILPDAAETNRTPWVGRLGRVDVEALAADGFIVPDAAPGALAEEIRIVKRQLLLGAAGGAAPKDRMILVGSAQSGDGKTFCAVNLALSMASEHDWQVLLVDADVAKPSVLSTLGLDAGPGLVDAISDPDMDVESCVIRTDIGSLSVLPAGRAMHDVTELIASERTKLVLDRLAGHARNRIILFDSPPALAASPASELAHHVGQLLLVVRADRTSEPELRDTIGLLSGCDTIRLLLNGAHASSGVRSFGGYGYGYGASA